MTGRSKTPDGSMTSAQADDFFCRTTVFDQQGLSRAVKRLSHEIIEKNRGVDNVALVGLYTRGVVLADRFAAAIAEVEGISPPVGVLDVAFHRDDYATRFKNPAGPTHVPDIAGKTVVLVDDVMFTGRTVRAALESLIELGRPAVVQLAVLVDRGHRELPIRADFVGKNLPTSAQEDVRVRLRETDGVDADSVQIFAPPADAAPDREAGMGGEA